MEQNILEPISSPAVVQIEPEKALAAKKIRRPSFSKIHALPATLSNLKDRPKWIPDHIVDNWDTDPYAYQTEEDLMPAGGLHGETLGDIWELISKRLRKRDMMLLMDVFMLFQDRFNEADKKGNMYTEAGISVWRQHPQTGCAMKVQPNDENQYALAEMEMSIGVHGQSIYFIDDETGEMLLDIETERMERKAERIGRRAAEKRVQVAEKRIKMVEDRLETERAAREAAETEIAQLRALLQQQGKNLS